MSTVSKGMLIFVCVSLALALAADPGPCPVEKAVLEAHARILEADQALDADLMFASILENGPGTIIQGAQLLTRQEALESVKDGMRGVTKVKRTFDQTRVTVLGPDTALLVGHGTTRITLDDRRTIERPFAVSMVFVLRDGQWKVLHGHFSAPDRNQGA